MTPSDFVFSRYHIYGSEPQDATDTVIVYLFAMAFSMTVTVIVSFSDDSSFTVGALPVIIVKI